MSAAALLSACRDGGQGTDGAATTAAPPGSSTSRLPAGTTAATTTSRLPGVATTTSSAGTGATTASSTTASSTPSSAGASSTGAPNGTGGPTSTSSASEPGPSFLEPAAAAAVSFPGSNPTAVLTAVRTGRQDGFDRVVFEFQAGDELPGYLVSYETLPLRADPSGEPLSVRGEVALVIRMQAASRFRFEDATLVYQGPSTVALDGAAITEVVLRGDFEALLSWAIGSTGRRPYRIGTLDGPPRIYVDIAT